MMPVELLSRAQVAEELGIPMATLGRWMLTKDIPEPCAVWRIGGGDGEPVRFWRPHRLPEWRRWVLENVPTHRSRSADGRFQAPS